MVTANPGSNAQIFSSATTGHAIPVVDLNRPDLGGKQYLDPAGIAIVGAGLPVDSVAAVSATLARTSAGADNDLTFTVVAGGVAGNSYTLTVFQAVALNVPLSVTKNGSAFTITLPSDGAGAPIATTANAVKAAWDPLHSTLITVVVEGTGLGNVAAATVASFTGGVAATLGTGFDTPAKLYIDTTTPGLHVNVGTSAAPNWTAV